MIYQWKDGARYSVSPQVAGNICKQLDERNMLTASALVDVSRPEDAPLHPIFEWDDSLAAEKYREAQARAMIRSIVTIPAKSENKPVRAFFNIQVEQPKYESLNIILEKPDKRALLLQSAYRELSAFKKKYSILKELTDVFSAIDHLMEENA